MDYILNVKLQTIDVKPKTTEINHRPSTIHKSHKTPNHKTSRSKYVLYDLGGHKTIKENIDKVDFIKIKICL